jgi:hypothetical protein
LLGAGLSMALLLAASASVTDAHAWAASAPWASEIAPPTEAWSDARLALWGAGVGWDDHWRAYVSNEETRQPPVVRIWLRFEEPRNADAGPNRSFVVMRELHCKGRAWRAAGVVSYRDNNLEGEAVFQPASGPWRSVSDADGDEARIFKAACRY